MIAVEAFHRPDLTKLVKACRRLHQASNWSWVPFSSAAMRKSLLIMDRRPDYQVFVAKKDGEICGLLVGGIDTVIYGNTRIASDIEFVAEAGGNELIKVFREWAIAMGAKVRLMADSNGGREDSKDRFFRMNGMDRIGGLYMEKL